MTFQLATTKFAVLFSDQTWVTFKNTMYRYALVFGVFTGILVLIFSKNLQALSQNVRRVNQDSLYHAFIRAEAPRLISKYAVQFDINGQYVVRRLDAGDSDLEADYVDVNFLLKHPEPYREGDVYIFGKFSDWQLLPEYKLKYDYARGAYLGNFRLKQGFYNYSYALAMDSGKINLETVEGSHWETENDYQILIYNREVGSRYDRLIGIGELSSEDLY